LRNHLRRVKIPYRDGNHHVEKGKCRGYLKLLYSRWGVEEGNLSDAFGDCLPNQDFPLGGESWISGVLGFSGNPCGKISSTSRM